MKVVYTEEALHNLDDIGNYIRQNYPAISEAFRLRFQFVIARIAKWPESAQKVDGQLGVRVVPLVRYPTRYFIGQRTRRSKYFTSITRHKTLRKHLAAVNEAAN